MRNLSNAECGMGNAECGILRKCGMRNNECGIFQMWNAEWRMRNRPKCGMMNAEWPLNREQAGRRAGWQAGPQGKGEAGGVKREAGNGRANCGFEGRTEGRRQATVARAGEKE